ncbi:uncharacterized protein LOC131668664 [Phymastichus coffea]|uniref:uncharacterized protein LOC131668664 n=1 Tax=Phymastichus coffea TaxID=108790 RepID=UPI00273A8908|nr:uncharacterized protein LOC131668664 [Phymastichus coffea]
MIQKVFTFIILFSSFPIHDCAESKVKVENAFIDFVNFSYVDEQTFHFSFKNESETKSSISLRIDIIKDIPEDFHVKVKIMGRTFGQYTLPTGVNVDVKFCQSSLNDFFQPYMNAAGITTCPPTKGTYESNDISTEVVGMPVSLIPGLHFLVEFETYASDIVLSKARYYIYVS